MKNSLNYISDSSFSSKDRIDQNKIEIIKVTDDDLKLIWNNNLTVK